MENHRSKEEPTGRSLPQERSARKAFSVSSSKLPISLWADDFSFSQLSNDEKNKLFRALSSDETSHCHRRNSDLATVMEALETTDEEMRRYQPS